MDSEAEYTQVQSRKGLCPQPATEHQLLNEATNEISGVILGRRFRKDLEESGGLLRVVVHPFFDLYSKDRFESPSPQKEDAVKVQSGFIRLVASNDVKKPPILILEDHRYMEETARTIEKANGSKTHIVPTYNDMSTPLYSEKERNEPKDWERFCQELKESGVNRIILGGVNLDYEVSAGGELEYQQCVGKAHRFLSPHFEVEFSRMTFPKKAPSK